MNPAEIWDEYGRLDLAEQQKTPEQKRLEVLKKTIQLMAESHPANEPLTYDGSQFFLQLTEKENQRRIVDLKAVYKYICAKNGLERFLELCSFSLAALENNVPEEKLSAFIRSEQTGSRRIKAVLRSIPQEAA